MRLNKLRLQNYYYYSLRKFLDEQQTLLLNLENEIIEKEESAEWKEGSTILTKFLTMNLQIHVK